MHCTSAIRLFLIQVIVVADAPHRFNIWNTGPDLNFDRIAHLAKLVFNTKGVVISLIDGNEQ